MNSHSQDEKRAFHIWGSTKEKHKKSLKKKKKQGNTITYSQSKTGGGVWAKFKKGNHEVVTKNRPLNYTRRRERRQNINSRKGAAIWYDCLV